VVTFKSQHRHADKHCGCRGVISTSALVQSVTPLAGYPSLQLVQSVILCATISRTLAFPPIPPSDWVSALGLLSPLGAASG